MSRAGRRPLRRTDDASLSNGLPETTGIAGFTILVSPDRFDLSRRIRVRVNGWTAVGQQLEPDVRTVMRWAVRDDDRTMLFAPELAVRP